MTSGSPPQTIPTSRQPRHRSESVFADLVFEIALASNTTLKPDCAVKDKMSVAIGSGRIGEVEGAGDAGRDVQHVEHENGKPISGAVFRFPAIRHPFFDEPSLEVCGVATKD